MSDETIMCCKLGLLINVIILFGNVQARSGLRVEEVPPSPPSPPPPPTMFQVQQCRDGCLEKVSEKSV